MALLSENRPQAVAVQLATHLTGCRFISYSTAATVSERAGFARVADAAVLIFDAPVCTEHADRLLAIARPRHVLSLGPAPFGRTLPARPGTVPDDVRPAVDAPAEQVLTVLQTGGTTGTPKGALHTHALYGQLRSLIGEQGIADPGERRLLFSQLSHIGGQFALTTLMSGGTLFLHNGFDPGAVLREIARSGITVVRASPPLLHHLLDHPDLADTDRSSLRRVGYGAGPASPRRLREAMAAFIEVVHELPLTSVGKIDKNALRRIFASSPSLP